MNIFDKFGLREVANVHLEALSDDSRLGVNVGDIVLYFDTLKLANIEGTAENVEARGGRGNPALISWDYGREVTMTLQDALFSVESLAATTGAAKTVSDTGKPITIRKSKLVTLVGDLPSVDDYKWINLENGTRGSLAPVYQKTKDSELGDQKDYYLPDGFGDFEKVDAPDVEDIDTYYEVKPLTGEEPEVFPIRVFYDETESTKGKATEVSINAEYFGGTYKLYGDTLIRDVDGKDHPYQVVIPKAKISSNFTFEMSPDGDPSVLDIDIRVLRDDNGDMVKLIRYDSSI